MRGLAAFAFILVVAVRVASADVRDFLGRPLAEIRVELGGQPLTDSAVLQLIETRVGEPLSMERVRIYRGNRRPRQARIRRPPAAPA